MLEHFIRMLQGCGLPAEDCDMIHGNGKVVNELLVQARPRSTLFTGSQKIAEKLAMDLKGKVCMGSYIPRFMLSSGIGIGDRNMVSLASSSKIAAGRLFTLRLIFMAICEH